MSNPDDTPGKKSLTRRDVWVFTILQGFRTLRVGIISSAVVVGVWIVARTVLKIMEIDQPPWVTVAIAVIAFLGGFLPPAIVAWTARLKIKTYFSKEHGRVVELEAALDPKRESSGLNPDGSSKHDL